MNNDRYNISYGSPLAIKDRPHREMTATRSDYGLPLPNKTDDNISYSEKRPSEDDVEILQPNIEEVEVSLV
jgi:hypothetical protein